MLRINLKRKNMMTWNNETRDIKDGKKESLFSELHSLLSSGLDFGRSFRLLIEGENDKRLKRVLESIYASVVKGQTLWESFAAGERFTALDYGVLRIGEETGRVDESLRFLADYYHKRVEQRRLVTGAISYPLIILVTAIVVLVFMITVIVPMFEQCMPVWVGNFRVSPVGLSISRRISRLIC